MPKFTKAERQQKRIEQLQQRKIILESKIEILQRGLTETIQELKQLMPFN